MEVMTAPKEYMLAEISSDTVYRGTSYGWMNLNQVASALTANGARLSSYLYRVEDHLEPPWPTTRLPNTKIMSTLYLRAFPIVRRTKRGAWIYVYGKGKWVNCHASRRFAHTDIKSALAAWLVRKQYQIGYEIDRLNRQEMKVEACKRLSTLSEDDIADLASCASRVEDAIMECVGEALAGARKAQAEPQTSPA